MGYRRVDTAGGTYFFTVNLAERSSDLLTQHIQEFREVWQRRYWEHQIRDENNFERHVAYIHYNPVKHGYVGRPIDWPFSTLRRYVQRGMLPENWTNGIEEVSLGGER